MTALRLAGGPMPTDQDALVVAAWSGPDGVRVDLDADLADAWRALRVTGEPGSVTLVAPTGPSPRVAPVVAAVGLGKRPDQPNQSWLDALRGGAAAAVRALPGRRRVTIALPARDPAELAAVAEGALLGAYQFNRYRSLSTSDTLATELAIWAPGDELLMAQWSEAVIRRAQIVAEAVNLARDLVNTAPADLVPAGLAAVAVAQALQVGLAVEVLDEVALRSGGFGGLVGVGQGSAHPPRLVRLTHPGPIGAPSIALVGKGITFDAGGLSLKAAAGLDQMKMDMAGAAAVLAAVVAAARLALPVRVDAWLPLAENLPSGAAMRPSDVLTMRDGRRVEVRDTDNEGRLVLADALARAIEEQPDIVIDVATLTSAQIIALGPRILAVMANENGLRERVVAAAGRSGEPAWGMPLPDHLRPRLDSAVADLANEISPVTGPVAGGMLLAGLFLREFTGDVAWAHLDIAGPAFNTDAPYGVHPSGATGAAVRTLVAFLAEWERA